MALSPEERETNIQWSEADKFARVQTFSPKEMRELAKHPRARFKKHFKDASGRVIGGYWRVPVPRRSTRIIPGKRRDISEAHRRAASERMKAVRRRTREA